MKDIAELLKQKEARIQQLRVEIEALRTVAPILASGDEARANAAAASAGNVTVLPSPAPQDDKVDLASFLTDVNS